MRTISSTSVATLILFVQVAMFLAHAPAALAVSSRPGEKLILGFEQTELSRGAYVSREEKPGRESWFYLLERSEGFDFAARFEWPGETNRAWTWNCRPGVHTEGELSLVANVAPSDRDNQTATYRQTEFLSYFYPNIRRGIRWQRRTILSCLQRFPSGQWEGSVDLTPEFTIDEYRSLAGFFVPPYAPENFVPLAWSDDGEGTVKLLKIPIPLTLPEDKEARGD